MKLSKAIAEFELSQLVSIWQKPDIYDEVKKGNTCLVYGRKGAGKSTLVEYLAREDHLHILLLQGRDHSFFNRVLTAIPSSAQAAQNQRTLTTNIGILLELLLCVELANKYSEELLHSGVISSFMSQNKLNAAVEPTTPTSIARSFLEKLTAPPYEFEGIMNAYFQQTSYDSFRDAVFQEVANRKVTGFVCIDDIDDIDYSFSFADQCFIDALLAFVVKTNLAFKKLKANIKVIMTCPSEIFFHSSLWGIDWVETQARCLHWPRPEALHELVNRRIAVEFSIRERRPKGERVQFSASAVHTWDRVFPKEIWNPFGTTESTFQYLLRHTFYNPRQILMLCDKVLQQLEELKGIDVRNPQTGQLLDISIVCHNVVSENCIALLRSCLNTFGKVYEGLERVLESFRLQPSIWHRKPLVDFVQSEGMKLTRRDNGIVYSGEGLVLKLQELGILGLGVPEEMFSTSTGGLPFGTFYKVRYSFLDEIPAEKAWKVAVFTPVAQKCYDMDVVAKIFVRPHVTLCLPNAVSQQLAACVPQRRSV